MGSLRKFIIVRTDFEAIHRWLECPFEDVSFLREFHRHKFFVEVKKQIEEDRGIEFIMFQREVKEFIRVAYEGKNLGAMSCERIAEDILRFFEASSVSVWEDNENGSEICMTSL